MKLNIYIKKTVELIYLITKWIISKKQEIRRIAWGRNIQIMIVMKNNVGIGKKRMWIIM